EEIPEDVLRDGAAPAPAAGAGGGKAGEERGARRSSSGGPLSVTFRTARAYPPAAARPARPLRGTGFRSRPRHRRGYWRGAQRPLHTATTPGNDRNLPQPH